MTFTRKSNSLYPFRHVAYETLGFIQRGSICDNIEPHVSNREMGFYIYIDTVRQPTADMVHTMTSYLERITKYSQFFLLS